MWRKIKLWFKNNFSARRQDDLSRMPQDVVKPPVTSKPDDQPSHPTDYRLWLPMAENIMQTEDIKMTTRGEYSQGYPEGLVVHWTAGWMLPKGILPNPFPKKNPFASIDKVAREKALQTAEGGVKNGFNFLVMDVLGRVYQSRPLDKHGYHAGKSYWPSVGYSVSNKFAGVEILNPGKLEKKGDKFLTWYGQEIPSELVRYIDNPKHGERGFYCQYTYEQEEALKKLIEEMFYCSPVFKGKRVFSIDNVVGHHEVSPGRKSDPSGSLSMTMEDLRNHVKAVLMI